MLRGVDTNLKQATCWMLAQLTVKSFGTSSCLASTTRRPGSLEQLSQAALCEQLLQQGLLSKRAAAAMEAVDRAQYVTVYEGVPGSIGYRDSSVPISCGQHMDAPSTHARFLNLLEPFVHAGSTALDIGAGSGYMAACLAVLAAPGGAVLAVEKHAKLAERARASIAASNPDLLQQPGLLTIKQCNAMADPPELQGVEQFDAIHVGASLQQVPQRFIDLLRPRGRLLLPLGSMHGNSPQVLMAIDKAADGSVTRSEHGTLATRIAPLTAVHDDTLVS